MADAPNTKELAQRLFNLSEAIARLNKQLQNSKKGSSEYKETLRQISLLQKEASKTSDDLTQKTARLSDKVRNHRDSLKQAREAQSNWNKTLKETNNITSKASGSQGFFGAFSRDKILSTIGTVTKFLAVYKLISFAGEAVNTVLVKSVQRFIELDKALANLAAVGGQGAADSLDLFKEQAINVANETKFTAVEIVKLQTELSKLGFSAEEVVASTASVAKAAQALGSSIDQTALVIGQTIRAFDLLAEQATYVSDTIVTAINKSALSFQSFQTAIQYVGPVAQSAGLTLSETAQAMGILADSGFRASRIGTGLRGVISELTENGEELIPTLRELRNQNISFSDAVELVGKTSAAQLLVLTRQIDKLEEASSSFTEFGAAARASANQLNSIDGALSLLNSSFDTYLTKLGESITRSTKFKSVITSIVRFFSEDAAQELVASSVLVETKSFEAFQSIAKQEDNFIKARERFVKEVLGVEDLDLFNSLLTKSGKTISETNKTLANASKGGKDYAGMFSSIQEASGGTINTIQELNDAYRGLSDAFDKSIEEQRKLDLIQQGASLSTDEYGKSIDALQEKKNKGLDIDRKQVDLIANKVLDANEKLNREIETNSELTDDQILIRKGQIQQNNLYLSQLGRIGSVSKDLASETKKELEDQFKLELNNLKEIIESRKEKLKRQKESLEVEIQLAKASGDQEKALEATTRLLNLEAEAFGELGKLVGDFNEKWKEASKTVGGEVIKIDTQTLEGSVDSLLDSISGLEISDKDILSLLTTIRQSVGNAIEDYGTEDAKEFARKTLDKLIKFLRDKGFDEETIKKFSELYTKTIFPPIDDAAVRESESQAKAAEEKLKERTQVIADIIRDSISTISDIYSEQQNAQFDALNARLENEKDRIKERADFEEDIIKSQLDSQLISQEEYAARLEQIKKKEIQRQNAVDKKIFEQEKKKDSNDANVRYLEALANIIPNLITEDKEANPILLGIKYAATSLLATAAWQSSLSAINKREFFPKKFAEGGYVYGPSHEEGGVPFTVNGRGGYEMEGGEYIINKQSASKYRSLLDQINGTKNQSKYKFATGGIVDPQKLSDKQLEYLEAIAQATTGTAINTEKPVQAFVSSSDIKNDTNARRIKERNSNI